MKHKDKINLVRKLLKELKKEWSPCSELTIGCPACNQALLQAHLEDYLYTLEL